MDVPIDIREPFISHAVQAVIDEGLLDRVDISKLTDDELASMPRITREQATDLARKFKAKIFNVGQHRQLATLLAVFIATYGDVAVDVDGDGVPDLPSSEERQGWFQKLFRTVDHDDS